MPVTDAGRIYLWERIQFLQKQRTKIGFYNYNARLWLTDWLVESQLEKRGKKSSFMKS